jgi:hypothetical protein
MDWKRLAGSAGLAGLFLAVVGVGSLTVASLLPGEPPAVMPDRPLLMENQAALKPFDAPPDPPPAQRRPPAQAALVLPPATPPAPPIEPPAPDPTAGASAAEAERPPERPRERPERRREAALPATPERREPRQPVVAVAPPAGQAADPVRRALTPPPAAAPRAPDGVLTMTEIRRIRLSLRLSRDQEPYWLPVEQLLRDIGTQQEAMVRAGQDPKDAFGTGAAMRMYSAAKPLLDVLREDQKAQVRARARAMGFGSVASSI